MLHGIARGALRKMFHKCRSDVHVLEAAAGLCYQLFKLSNQVYTPGILNFTAQWRIVARRVGAYARNFIAGEWTKAPVGAVIGLIGAIFKRLLADDQAFQATLSKVWAGLATKTGFSGIDFYVPILAVLVGIVAIAFLLRLLPFLVEAFKSWLFGIVSGLIVWWGISFFVFFSQDSLFLFQ